MVQGRNETQAGYTNSSVEGQGGIDSSKKQNTLEDMIKKISEDEKFSMDEMPDFTKEMAKVKKEAISETVKGKADLMEEYIVNAVFDGLTKKQIQELRIFKGANSIEIRLGKKTIYTLEEKDMSALAKMGVSKKDIIKLLEKRQEKGNVKVKDNKKEEATKEATKETLDIAKIEDALVKKYVWERGEFDNGFTWGGSKLLFKRGLFNFKQGVVTFEHKGKEIPIEGDLLDRIDLDKLNDKLKKHREAEIKKLDIIKVEDALVKKYAEQELDFKVWYDVSLTSLPVSCLGLEDLDYDLHSSIPEEIFIEYQGKKIVIEGGLLDRIDVDKLNKKLAEYRKKNKKTPVSQNKMAGVGNGTKIEVENGTVSIGNGTKIEIENGTVSTVNGTQSFDVNATTPTTGNGTVSTGNGTDEGVQQKAKPESVPKPKVTPTKPKVVPNVQPLPQAQQSETDTGVVPEAVNDQQESDVVEVIIPDSTGTGQTPNSGEQVQAVQTAENVDADGDGYIKIDLDTGAATDDGPGTPAETTVAKSKKKKSTWKMNKVSEIEIKNDAKTEGTYKVKKGDTLGAIMMAKYGIKAKEISTYLPKIIDAQSNKDLRDQLNKKINGWKGTIYPGNEIFLPAKDKIDENYEQRAERLKKDAKERLKAGRIAKEELIDSEHKEATKKAYLERFAEYDKKSDKMTTSEAVQAQFEVAGAVENFWENKEIMAYYNKFTKLASEKIYADYEKVGNSKKSVESIETFIKDLEKVIKNGYEIKVKGGDKHIVDLQNEDKFIKLREIMESKLVDLKTTEQKRKNKADRIKQEVEDAHHIKNIKPHPHMRSSEDRINGRIFGPENRGNGATGEAIGKLWDSLFGDDKEEERAPVKSSSPVDVKLSGEQQDQKLKILEDLTKAIMESKVDGEYDSDKLKKVLEDAKKYIDEIESSDSDLKTKERFIKFKDTVNNLKTILNEKGEADGAKVSETVDLIKKLETKGISSEDYNANMRELNNVIQSMDKITKTAALQQVQKIKLEKEKYEIYSSLLGEIQNER